MADGKITIDTEIDKSGLDKGVKNVSKSVNGLKKAISGIGISAVIGAEVKVLKDLCNGIQDTAKAYNTQLKAETLLKASAKTNPYLNGESVNQLKKFAGELQSISTYGDEQLLPMMAQLSSSGRTEAEIMDIMTAAVDVASTGVISLDSAVQGLNMSYSGQLGTLGRTIPALKGMTAEQLKNGDAIAYVKQQYAGMAEETTKATGSYEQMKNAQGDYLEALGTLTKPTSDLWNNFWKGWYERGIESINKLNAFIDKNTIGKNNVKTATTGSSKGKDNLFLSVYARNSDDESLAAQIAYIEGLKKKTEAEENYLRILKLEQEQREGIRKIETEDAKKKSEKKKEDAKQAEKAKTAEDYLTANSSSLNEKLAKIETERKMRESLGETIDENAYHQERLNAMMESYVSLISDSNGQIDESNSLSKERIAQMKEESEKITEMKDALEDIQKLESIFSKVTDAISNLSNAASNMMDMLTENIEANATVETAKAEEQYANGLISYEEYCAKKEQIAEDSAEKEYEIQMWAWGIQLLQAQASTALSMIQTLADTTITSTAAKIAMMATVGALGATQLASIIASKPTKNFTNGGFVGGSSYTGDTVRAGLNSGELVANRQQQAALWRAMNGGGGGGFSQSITIENNAADSVSIGQSVSEDKLIFTVNKIVNSEMKRGTYTNSMNEANAKQNGVKYL